MALFRRRQEEQPPPEPQQPLVNELVQRALAAWGAAKNAQTLAGVLRQCVIGELLLDATDSSIADPARPFAQGDTLAVAQQVDDAGRRLLLAYTSNERLQARRQRADTRSLVQPAAEVLRSAMTGHDGIAIDPGHPDGAIAYADEIRANVGDDPGARTAIKQALADRDRAALLDALAADPPVLLPTGPARDATGAETGVIVLTAVDRDGGRLGVLTTCPAEAWAWDPAGVLRPTHVSNVLRVALEDGQAGVVVNPADGLGRLTPDECRALLTRIGA